MTQAKMTQATMTHLISIAWMALTGPEQAAALALAQQEGRRQARKCCAAEEPTRLEGDPECARAEAQTGVASEPPKDVGRWSASGEGDVALAWFILWGRHMRGLRPSQWLEEALDPRFCHLMVSFQREWCRRRRTAAPPEDVPGLETALREAKEEELRRARDLYEVLVSEEAVAPAAREQGLAAYEEALAETHRTLLLRHAVLTAPAPGPAP